MFRPFKVLRVGGAALSNNATAPGTTAAAVIDFSGPVPKITTAASMPVGLQWHNATTLPDGNVVVTGGSSIRNQLVGTNYIAYLWNSTTGRWSSGAPTTSGKARLYHSIALLLPDASVLVGGGASTGRRRSANQHQRRDLLPPYLYDSSGPLVTSRPTITAAPASLAAGQSFQVRGQLHHPDRPADPDQDRSVTHAFNLEQRFVELSFTTSGTTLTAQVPARPGGVPPGRWMLFAFDADGVPSVARLVSVAPRSSARVSTDWIPAFGTGNDGTAFTAACPIGTRARRRQRLGRHEAARRDPALRRRSTARVAGSASPARQSGRPGRR